MKTFNHHFNRWLTIVENVLLTVSGVIILGMMAAITVNALGRYVFNKPVVGIEALVELFLAPAATYFAISSALRFRQHVGVTIAVVRLPRLARRWSQIFAVILVAALFAVIAYTGLVRTLDAFTGNRVDDTTGIPLWMAYATVPIGAAVLSLRAIQIGLEWVVSGAWQIAVALPDRADDTLAMPSA